MMNTSPPNAAAHTGMSDGAETLAVQCKTEGYDFSNETSSASQHVSRDSNTEDNTHNIACSFGAGSMRGHANGVDHFVLGRDVDRLPDRNIVERIHDPYKQITQASIKKEPGMVGNSGQPVCYNWERNVEYAGERSSIKVENNTTSLCSPATAQPNCVERPVPDMKLSGENKGPVSSAGSESPPLSLSVQTMDQTTGSGNLSSVNTDTENSDSTILSTTQQTRSSLHPFVLVPNLDSSDSGKELEPRKSPSDSSNIYGVNLIKQKPEPTDSLRTKSHPSLRLSCKRPVTEIGAVGKRKSCRKARSTKPINQTPKRQAKSSATVKESNEAETKTGSKTCSICEKKFSRPESLTIHMRVHTGDRPYQCQHCDATYKIAGHLRDHVRSKHSSSRPFLCTKCGKDFSYQTARRRHEKTCGKNFSERIEFRCEICEKEFVTAKGFAKHQNTCGLFGQGEHAEKELPFKCNACEKSFATSLGLERHQRFICGKVYSKRLYFCEECNKTYEKKGRFHAHMRRHRGEKPFKCSLCDNQFYDQGALKKHLKKHEENRKFRCSMCEVGFYEKQTLSVHVMRVHCGLKPFKCNECDADMSSAYQLSRHIRNLHRLERPFKCTLCSKEFFDAKRYKKHMYQHTIQLTNPNQFGSKGPKLHTCNICNQAFIWICLRAHVVSEHPGMSLSDVVSQKVLECDLCSKEFSSRQTLRVHKRSHSRAKHFKCDKCDRQFAVPSALRYHSTNHSKDRPHCCQDCGKTFRWLSNLSSHRVTHHGPEPDHGEGHIDTYVCNKCGRVFKREHCLYLHLKLKCQGQGTPCICSQCGRGFTDTEEYKNHMSTHDPTTAKPYICSACGAGFYYQHILDRHRRQRHAEFGRSSWLCEKCGKLCTRKIYFRKHMARHAKYPEGRIPFGRPKKEPQNHGSTIL